MPDKPYQLRYRDIHGNASNLSEKRAGNLAKIKEIAPFGKFTKSAGKWPQDEVQSLQDRGLVDVEWGDPEDVEREGNWRILRITKFGEEVLKKWQQKETTMRIRGRL